ncbi:MAG: hypothetical protein K0U74_11595 [Alphaproteobacteria bacterium]|nr:hypothetical protein [Alphaproteobacteria bacterium]
MRVSQLLILIPVFVQVILTLMVFAVCWRRRSAGPSGDQLAGLYGSLFQLPVLFYVATAFAFSMRAIDERMLLAAMAFVVAQLVEVTMAIGSGSGGGNSLCMAASGVAVATMWGLIGLQLFASGF